jgi:hypothetical protein
MARPEAAPQLGQERPQFRHAHAVVFGRDAVRENHRVPSVQFGFRVGRMRREHRVAGIAHLVRMAGALGKIGDREPHGLGLRIAVAEFFPPCGQRGLQQRQRMIRIGEARIGAADRRLDRRAIQAAGREAAIKIGRRCGQHLLDRNVRIGGEQRVRR